MKRRIFLSAASTIGIAGAVSSASVVSSAYSSVSTSLLLEDFSPSTRIILDKFQANAVESCQELGLNAKHAKVLTTPVQIISKTTKGDDQHITFKNKAGEYVSLSIINGAEKIKISKTLN